MKRKVPDIDIWHYTGGEAPSPEGEGAVRLPTPGMKWLSP
jgi:hypothetical protein